MSGQFDREEPMECPTDDGAALLRAEESCIHQQQQLELQQITSNEPFFPIVSPTSMLSATQENWHNHDEIHANLEDSACQAEPSVNLKKRSLPEASEGETSDTEDERSGLTGSQRPSKRQQTQRADTFERTRFKDIIGHGEVKLRIEEMLLPMALPPSVADSVLTGIRALPTSILLHGPPGCGKTQLARAIAGEARAAFYSIAPSDILSKFVGESEAAVRSIFRTAMEHAQELESKCSVVFFDEVDALGQSRSESGTAGEGEGCSRRVLAELLMELNRIADRATRGPSDKSIDKEYVYQEDCDNGAEGMPIETNARVLVVAATNRVADCDPALLRRFGTRVFVGPPSKRDRKKMLEQHLKEINHCLTPADINFLAMATDNWSGSDIQSVAREAAMAPVRECIRSAVLLRKRASRREQQGASQETNPDLEARRAMIEGVQQLRPVSLSDFAHAIDFFVGHADKSDLKAHYDSSSDEDSE